MSDEPSAPGYMLLYGLLMTLLMTFFILLVSMGTQEKNKKMNTVITSIKSAFGAFGEGGAGILEGGGAIISKPDVVQMRILRLLKSLKVDDLQGIEFTDKKQKAGQPIKVTYDSLGRIHISFPEKLFFKQGFKLTQKAKLFLQQILALYFDTPYGITIAGYAGGFGKEQDWIKGFYQALNIMKYLHEQGVPFVHLYPEGHRDDSLNKEVRIEIILRAKDILERS